MTEAILAQFFKGEVAAATLAADLKYSEKRVSDIESTIEIEDMQDEFFVSREMALRLCDAVLDQKLPPQSLSIVGFAVLASDKFVWDGDDTLGDVIADWAAPEDNYLLKIENVGKFRSWLEGTEEYPVKTGDARCPGRVVSVRSKKSLSASDSTAPSAPDTPAP